MIMKKKEPSERTRVVIRHLPPSLSQFHLFSQFDHLFSQRYNWFCFRPAKFSQKHQRYSRAYIDFKNPGDVLEFADIFHGHIFYNERGSQFKAIVEYAPSQRVPKTCTLKDDRDGTIYKDPDYLEFLKLIAKPVENLHSAEPQLERKEAEQSASAKESPVTTPLMEYVRQKRAAKDENQDASAGLKDNRKARSASVNKPGSSATRKGAQKKKHNLKGSAKNSNHKSKSTILAAPNQGDQPANQYGKEISGIQSVSSVGGHVSISTLTGDSGKKRIPLLKGKEYEISAVSGGMLHKPGNPAVAISHKQNQRFKTNERLVKGILLNKEAHKNQPLAGIQPWLKFQNSSLKNDKRSPWPIDKLAGSNGHLPNIEPIASTSNDDVKQTSDGKFLTRGRHSLASSTEKQEKSTRNNNRPDNGVWTPLGHSDVQCDNDQFTNTMLQQKHSDSVEGSHKRFGHHVAVHKLKDNSSLIASEWKYTRRGGASSYAVHEKQVWVQKSTSGSWTN
ncbi:regulator of nonsense transcripts UPF3 isoform X1 [Jatropha curcas]|uniref:regulator of nonsense transcripts UPF3 isoform X1 n=1 Tax=Jatropha curcas TaxID=180498 RepID=UPI0005FC2A47|nr:regulator of nonsense transcripts UPF3 isoform X1 [Jatropha curcas]XP_037497185.1 regulator of nonsense transcripts UPF3 isoform X1 [Jatropha curcas]XP_037497186.1 regulator of nonsense transcripts UPF3 isoform X1 [Jatropha curcas]